MKWNRIRDHASCCPQPLIRSGRCTQIGRRPLNGSVRLGAGLEPIDRISGERWRHLSQRPDWWRAPGDDFLWTTSCVSSATACVVSVCSLGETRDRSGQQPAKQERNRSISHLAAARACYRREALFRAEQVGSLFASHEPANRASLPILMRRVLPMRTHALCRRAGKRIRRDDGANTDDDTDKTTPRQGKQGALAATAAAAAPAGGAIAPISLTLSVRSDRIGSLVSGARQVEDGKR